MRTIAVLLVLLLSTAAADELDCPYFSALPNYERAGDENREHAAYRFGADSTATTVTGRLWRVRHTAAIGAVPATALQIRRHYAAALHELGGAVRYEGPGTGEPGGAALLTGMAVCDGSELWLEVQPETNGAGYWLTVVARGVMPVTPPQTSVSAAAPSAAAETAAARPPAVATTLAASGSASAPAAMQTTAVPAAPAGMPAAVPPAAAVQSPAAPAGTLAVAPPVAAAHETWRSALATQGYINVYINFEVNKAVIRPEYRSVIDTIAALLQADTTIELSIEGHTDNTGDSAANRVLSLNRAKAVWQALISRGIDFRRLIYFGWGQDKPIADNRTAEGQLLNRRVELVKRR
ncbi:MAG TPA: OmpA family protein [bacterium]|nr:OmpA family protein [bacterium]